MFIYVIGAPRGPKKVGCARDVTSRLRQLQTAYHRPLSILFSVEVPTDTCSTIERRAHWLLQDSRAEGEWFKVKTSAAIDAVRQAAAKNGAGELARPSAGRPSLGVKQTMVRLTDEQRGRIESLVGKSRMAAFIREAVDNELKRRERQKPDKE